MKTLNNYNNIYVKISIHINLLKNTIKFNKNEKNDIKNKNNKNVKICEIKVSKINSLLHNSYISNIVL